MSFSSGESPEREGGSVVCHEVSKPLHDSDPASAMELHDAWRDDPPFLEERDSDGSGSVP